MMNLIGIDVGTTGCKTLIVSPEGRVLGGGHRTYGISCESPLMAEQDVETVWKAMCESTREAAASANLDAPAAVAVSVQGDAIIPLSESFQPLYPAILGMDYRSAEYAQKCAKAPGARRLFELTGMRPHPINSILKALWFRDHRPEQFAKTRHIVTYADFLAHRLCGRLAIDTGMASRTMAYDLQARSWASSLLGELDLDESLLSDVEPSGSELAEITPAAASQTGIPVHSKIVAGGHDAACSALGAGSITERLGVIAAGTADVLTTAFREPKLNDAMYEGGYPCYIHVKPDMYFTFSLNHVGGILFQWYRDTFFHKPHDAGPGTNELDYEQLIAECGERPSPVMLLPHFNGSGSPTSDIYSRGALVGLSLATKRADITRSVLESIAYETRTNLEQLSKAGIDIDRFRIVGGCARSRPWVQIRADILQRPIGTLVTREAACVGAAILAGTGGGVFGSYEDAVEALVRVEEVVEPNGRLQSLYDERFDIFRTLYGTLSVVSHRLADWAMHEPDSDAR